MQRKNDKLDRLRAEDRVLKHLNHTLAPTSNIILRRNRSRHTSTRQTNIATLSNYTLSNGEQRLLSRGLSFCPSRDINPVDLCQDMEQYLRRIKLKEYFQNDDTNSSPQTPLSREPSHKKSNWTPPSGGNQYIDSYVQTARGHLDRFILDNHHHSNKDNLTVNERKAIKTLRSNFDIAIKPADKGAPSLLWTLLIMWPKLTPNLATQPSTKNSRMILLNFLNLNLLNSLTI
ncbi:hypothetical protein HOLleu_44961 [Holothuria leucospilota]|uniref:Uncharacterized protein n=1 Tax=Holothuria leucospilota TaxID=206669 RepID=A0A9Q0YCQ6_HOLLE|nr:hypothetical protein HOLleu_44961 [Holothuria leucospilota]